MDVSKSEDLAEILYECARKGGEEYAKYNEVMIRERDELGQEKSEFVAWGRAFFAYCQDKYPFKSGEFAHDANK